MTRALTRPGGFAVTALKTYDMRALHGILASPSRIHVLVHFDVGIEVQHKRLEVLESQHTKDEHNIYMQDLLWITGSLHCRIYRGSANEMQCFHMVYLVGSHKVVHCSS